MDGGGIACSAENVEITNCVITQNRATRYVGGGLHDAGPGLTLTNSIVWNNLPGAVRATGDPPAITYCDIEGGWDGTGNIDADPDFAFPEDSPRSKLIGECVLPVARDAGIPFAMMIGVVVLVD